MRIDPSRPGREIDVLWLEDSPLDAELGTVRLERAGFRPRIDRVDGEAGFREGLARRYDLVLADFSLPGFSGAEALDIARALAPDTPFVVVSGMLGEEHAVEMLKRGATDYVLKQRLERLPMVVERALAEAAERRSRIAAERALQATERGYRALVDALRDHAVIMLDPSGRIGSWTPAAERIFGWSAHEAIGRGRDVFLAEDATDADWAKEIGQAVQSGTIGAQRWMRRKDGRRFFGNCTMSAMRDADGRLAGFSKVVRDATVEHLAAERLAAAKEAAEAASRAKDEFLAVLSHELRTPLAPVLIAVRLLRDHASLSGPLQSTLEVIDRNVRLEARLIDDLLDLTRIAQGRLLIEKRPIGVAPLIERVLEMCAAEIEGKRLAVTVDLRLSRDTVDGDATRLQQVLWNVMRNAVKFTPADGSIDIVAFQPSPGTLAVSITDSGIGIAPDALDRIFAIFQQADGAIVRQFGGTGIGLSIARALAELHGGVLRASSDGAGCGATFTLELPLAAEGVTAPSAVAHAAPLPSAGAARVLLVEDHEDTLQVMRQMLHSLGYDVVAARSVASAERTLEGDDPFDVLVSDIGLPDGSGLQVVRAFRARLAEAGAIALTGYGREDDVRRCREAGFTMHLTKPVTAEALQAALGDVARLGLRARRA